MAKKKKHDHCAKCGRFGDVEEHHILPQCEFGDGETIKLCPNCHTEFHTYLGRKNLKGKSIEFHVEKFYRWFYGVGLVALIGLIIKLLMP